MTLSSGTRLGPYEITAKLGEGGMGEVYRATDTRLKREVAIKVLSQEFTEDKERLARFEREAQLLAQLHHPNIASIFGLEEADGTRALVMELVEGPTLAERLESGAFSIAESLSAALQIAQALEEAHEKGIVHRDLKPQNIKASIEGKIKVLDFGLAKAMDPSAGSAASVGDLARSPTLMQSPTLTAVHGTQLGVILGTAAYMAPEQARGRAVDRRADIWSFGVVLWEMLAGRRLFEGETVSDTLAAVLTREIDLGALPAATPAAVIELVSRCLVREPRERLQWIGEARLLLAGAPRLALEEAARQSGGRGRLPRALPWALALGLAVALAATLVFARRPSPVAETITAEIAPPPGTAFDLRSRGPGPVAISPDGTRVAFAAQSRDAATLLYVRALADGRLTAYPGSEGAQFPFWSPDGRWIAFFSRVDGTLKRVPAEGGTPLRICHALNGKGGSWGRDDVVLFAPGAGTALYRVSAAGGESAAVTELGERYNSHRHPRFLPDGRHFLFLARSSRSAESAVLLGSLDGGKLREVLRSTTQAEFASGHLLFARDSFLLAQPFDPARAMLSGEARPIADAVLQMTAAGYTAFSASTTGRLALHSGESQAPVAIELRDRAGRVVGAVGTPGAYRAPSFSPDGRWLATTGAPGADMENSDVWLFDLRNSSTVRFTVGREEEVDATWAPDGRSLFYGSNPKGPPDVFRQSLDGSAASEVVYEAPGMQVPTGVSRDGRFLFIESEKGERTAILAFDLGSRNARAIRDVPYEDSRAVLSPDGRWLAFTSDETGRPEVYVTPFPGAGRTWPVSTGGGRYPAWREDGKEIVYSALDGRFLAVPAVPEGGTFRIGTATELFRSTPPTRDYRDWGMSPDAQRFAIVPSGVLEANNELRLIVNWPARLEKR